MANLAINNNYSLNFYGAQESHPSLSLEADLLPRPYFGQGSSNIPGLFNLYCVPSDFIASLRDQTQADRFGDGEGTHENWLRILEAPFNASSSFFNNMDFLLKILSYFGVHPEKLTLCPSLAKKVPILGLIVCAIEAVIEIRGMKKAASMLKLLNLPKNFASMQDQPGTMDEILVHALQSLNQKYCKRNLQAVRAVRAFVRKKFPRLSEEQHVEKIRNYEDQILGARHRSLNRRLYPRCSERVQKMVPQLLQEFSRLPPQERPAWRARACALLTDVKIQSKKKMLMHVIGLLAVIITVAGLIATLCLCPYVIPLVLLIVGGAFSCVRYGVSEGMMHTVGWKFDAGNLIPDCIKAIYRKIFSRCISYNC